MAICWSTNNECAGAPRQTRVTAIQLNRRPVTFGIPMPDSTPVPRHRGYQSPGEWRKSRTPRGIFELFFWSNVDTLQDYWYYWCYIMIYYAHAMKITKNPWNLCFVQKVAGFCWCICFFKWQSRSGHPSGHPSHRLKLVLTCANC